MTDDLTPPVEAPPSQTRRASDNGEPEVRRGMILAKIGVGALVIVALVLLAYGAWATHRVDERSTQTHDVACVLVKLVAKEQQRGDRLTAILEDGTRVLISTGAEQDELVAELRATLDQVNDGGVGQLPEDVVRLRCPT